MRGAADDEEQFDRCFDQHWTTVVRYLLRRGAASHAEDLASETFAIAWSKWGQLPSTPLPWLLKTAGFCWANERRRLQRADSFSHLLRPIVTDDPSHEHVSMRQDTTLVLTAIAALGDVEREALILTSWDELSAKDAASVLDCSVTALRVRVHRARKKIRACLDIDENADLMHGALVAAGREVSSDA